MILSWNGLLITGTYTPGRQACVNLAPEDCYPEDPPEFEVESVRIDDLPTFEGCFCDEPIPELPQAALESIARQKLSLGPYFIGNLVAAHQDQITEAATEHWDELRRDA